MSNVTSSLLETIQKHLESLNFPRQYELLDSPYANELIESHLYPLQAGGKRIRPLLTLLMAASIGGINAIKTGENAALAIELLHTYTLVHDDLPCMDNDDLRRGKPTTHKVYGEAKALLTGDGLLTHAFFLLSQTDWQNNTDRTKLLVQILSDAAGPTGVIYGQWLDISLTGKNETTWEDMELVHTYKTGTLIAASLELGAICGFSHCNLNNNKIAEKIRGNIRKAGILIGIAFQIVDDILDSTKTSNQLGKTAGKDVEQDKFTAPRLLGFDKAVSLSNDYTLEALTLLKEAFSILPSTPNTEAKSTYQEHILQVVKKLLSRDN